MKLIIYFLLALVIFVSCTEQKPQNESVKTIVLSKSTDFLPISSFISELDYLELKISEVNKEIGEIQDIKVFDKDLIIKQRKAGEISFIRFTEDGEYMNEIVNNSKGNISTPLDLIQYKKDYAVLCENGIHVVSKQGEYKGKIVSGEMAGGTFFASKNRFYAINEGPSNEFLSEYTANSKTKKIDKLDERMNRLIYTDMTSDNKENYHLFSSFSDIIYQYSNNKLLPKYKLKGGEYPTLSQVWENIGDRDEKETMRYLYNTQHVLVKNYLENDEIIFMTYRVGSHLSTVIIKREHWETRYYAQGVNDIDGGIWDKALYLSDKNELYIPLSAYKIAGHKISNKRHKDFENLQLHIAASGNPVIMRCRLE